MEAVSAPVPATISAVSVAMPDQLPSAAIPPAIPISAAKISPRRTADFGGVDARPKALRVLNL